MHYELWGHHPGHLIAVFNSEAEALAYVRKLLADGWSADDLSLGLEPDDDPEAADLPPVLQGAELLDRAHAA
jgi:hypothetical protein